MDTVLDQPATDFSAIELRQQATWASGDYADVGPTLQIVGETLAEAANVRADETVLDVAAGHGNASPAAARRHAVAMGQRIGERALSRNAAAEQ